MDNPTSPDQITLQEEVHRLRSENQQLKQELEASSRFEIDLISKVSNDLHIPINVICGYTQLLSRHILSDHEVKKLRQISDAALFLSNAFDNLKQHARLCTESCTIINSTFDLQQLISKLNHSYIRRCQEKDITFRLHQMDVPNLVIGDSKKLIQVLSTILDNAVKFTHEGMIEFYVESINDIESNKSLLRFRIKDTGIGFDDSQSEKIFTSFNRIHRDIDTPYFGLGISLSISKMLVERMNGTISVHSKEGQGSEFIVDLSFSLPTTEQASLDDHPSDLSLYGLHILLAEDNYFNQRIAVETLQTLGANVTLAKDGTEVVMMAKTQYFDIILMDIHMPIIDGFKATREIKRAGITTPIVAFTSDSLEDTYNAVFAAGMSDIINKPFNIDELVDTIQLTINKMIIY